MQFLKVRIHYFFIFLLIIISGFSTRKYSEALSPFIADHFGDALWAAMVYFGFRLLMPKKETTVAAFLAFLFSYMIEVSQLYQASWINEIRSTGLGALVLGKGFLWIDLVRYTSGIIVAYYLDKTFLRPLNT